MKFLALLLPLFLSTQALAATLTLSADNTLVLADEVSAETLAPIMVRALEMDMALKDKEPIYLVLYTPGGGIDDGLGFIDFLQGLHRPVHTVTVFAASMGFQIAQSLGTRYITNYGTLMSHKARGTFGGEFPGQLNNRLNHYLTKLDELDNGVVARSKGKLTKEKYQAMYENEYWVDGFKAASDGVVDEVATVYCDKSLTGTKETMVNFLGFSIKVTLSKCPVITGPLSVEAMIQTPKGLVTLNTYLSMGGVLSNNSKVQPLSLELINEELEEVRLQYTNHPKVIYTVIPNAVSL